MPEFHVERFVGTLAVKLIAEAIEFALLSATGVSRRAGRFGFERAMHAFVASVLLRFTGFDELG